MTMLNNIISFAEKHNMFPNAGLTLVCVSGGADSMCLLEALLEILPAKGGQMVGAVHFNHKLRWGESDSDEGFVKKYCREREVMFFSGSGDTKRFARENGLGIEDAARRLRYAFFEETAKISGAVRIATAHTADDNAETVIMNLTRGAGLAGILGIPPVRENGKIIRPMLNVTREQVIEFITERKIPYIEDSSNALDIFTRNKIRRKVIPVLREINPGLLNTVSTLTELLRKDEEYLALLADTFINEHCKDNAADITELVKLPEAISGRVIRKLYGGNLSSGHVRAVLELCAAGKPSGALSLPGMTVFREYGRLAFGGGEYPDGFAPVCPSAHETVIIPESGLKMTCQMVECDDTINKSLTCFLFKYIDICGKITVRPRREGDFIRLCGHGCTKTLKKLFIEHRIPARKRPLVPVIADESGVLAVYGLGADERIVPNPGDMALEIKFEEDAGL